MVLFRYCIAAHKCQRSRLRLFVGHLFPRVTIASSFKRNISSLSAETFAGFLHTCGLSKKRLHQEFYPLEKGQCASNDEFPIAVAISGGADSMALMLLLKEYLQENQINTPLLAVTVDHQLRLESSKEALQVAKICAECGNIKHVTKVCEWHSENAKPHTRGRRPNEVAKPMKPRNSKLEEQARHYRYDLLWQVCQEYRVRCLFVAHNRGDQLETMLFRLGRASGINGLAGMAQMQPFLPLQKLSNQSNFSENNAQNKVTLIRPLLSVTKDELMATCARFHQTWIHDPSNDNAVFDRVRIRQELKRVESEQGSDILDLFARFQLVAQKAKNEFARVERAMLRKYVVIWDPDRVIVQMAVFHDPKMFDELLYRVLSIIIVHVGTKGTPPRLTSVMRLGRDLQLLQTGKQITLGGCRLKRIAKGCLLEVQPE